MPSTSEVRGKMEHRPCAELADWEWVQLVLAERVKKLSAEKVAKNLGFSRNFLSLRLLRIRWMATVKLGAGVPFGTTEQGVAKEFIAVWDKYAPRTATPPVKPFKPMSVEVGKAVSDAIRMAEYQASGASIARIGRAK